MLAQVDEFFSAQLAGVEDPDAALEENDSAEFPAEMLECGS